MLQLFNQKIYGSLFWIVSAQKNIDQIYVSKKKYKNVEIEGIELQSIVIACRI